MPITRCTSTRYKQGFTLTELMITLVIISILAAIAVPMYTAQVRKTYRADAKSALTQLASAMERFHTQNNTYAGTTATAGGPPVTTLFPSQVPIDQPAANTVYNLTISGQGGVGLPDAMYYTLTATPIAGRRMDGDGALTLASSGAKTYKGAAGWND